MNSNDDTFEKLIKERVSAYFDKKQISKYADVRLLIKGVIFLFLFIYAYLVIIFSRYNALIILAHIVAGMCLIFLAINIGHEAVHGSVSKNKALNKIGLLTFHFAGVSSYLWQLKHLNSHHKYTNIPGLDTDFQQSKLVRLDYSYPKSKFHKYQHIYIPLFYLLYTFHWTFIKDFKESIKLKKERKTSRTREFGFVKMTLFKALYVLVMLIIPYFITSFNIVIIISFILTYLISGLFFGLFLIPIHINDYAIINNNLNSNKPDFINQLEATPNYSTGNSILNFILGGFNHHACHHLFPNISHVHYPEITQILRKTCNELHVRYVEISLRKLLVSHYHYIKKLSTS